MAISKARSITVNRFICVMLVVFSTWLFFVPLGSFLESSVEVLVRAYLLFLCGVMGHEGSHGNLGSNKSQNAWWSRFVFLPIAVPNAPFRLTHPFHHAFTNIPGKDPDLLLKMDSLWQFPGRALAMPHYWSLWLKKRGRLSSKVVAEIALSYVVYILFYGTLINALGPERVLYSLIPAQIINSFILWYPFAIKTHEGHSVGEQRFRSHDYYGKAIYWLSMGLSMHRAHHMHPRKSWLELGAFVKPAPIKDQVRLKRDILVET